MLTMITITINTITNNSSSTATSEVTQGSNQEKTCGPFTTNLVFRTLAPERLILVPPALDDAFRIEEYIGQLDGATWDDEDHQQCLSFHRQCVGFRLLPFISPVVCWFQAPSFSFTSSVLVSGSFLFFWSLGAWALNFACL